MLQRRLDALLETEPYKSKFVKEYDNVLTEEGLIPFCLVQCVNPNRIPAMVISDSEGNFLDNPNPGEADPVCGNSKLYQYLGIQTDYSPEGRGVITPEMIESILKSVN